MLVHLNFLRLFLLGRGTPRPYNFNNLPYSKVPNWRLKFSSSFHLEVPDCHLKLCSVFPQTVILNSKFLILNCAKTAF